MRAQGEGLKCGRVRLPKRATLLVSATARRSGGIKVAHRCLVRRRERGLADDVDEGPTDQWDGRDNADVWRKKTNDGGRVRIMTSTRFRLGDDGRGSISVDE